MTKATALISSIRSLTDKDAENFCKILHKDEDIVDILLDYLEDLTLQDDDPKVEINVPMEVTWHRPDGEVWYVSKKVFETILTGEADEIISLKEYYGGKIFSEWLMLLRMNDRDITPVIDVVLEEDGRMATYFKEGVMLGSDMLNAELFWALEKKRLKDELVLRPVPSPAEPAGIVMVDACTSPLSPRPRGKTMPKLEPLRVVSNTLESLGKIDLSKGPGQYIGGKISESIYQSNWADGMNSHDITYCENTFRLLQPRKRLDKLREVYHTNPTSRGRFDILLYHKENVVFLRYKGRLITMGYAHELPKSPDWKARDLNVRPPKALPSKPVRIKRSDSSFSSLASEEECH